jgi:hypothetical protein
LKRLGLDEKIPKEGRAESGVCRSVRVVNGMLCSSDGNGPVTVGYTPVQYDMVVVTFGDGKTKLTAASPYDITFVTAWTKDEDVWFRPKGGDEVTTGEVVVVVVVNVNVEVRVLGEKVPELRRDPNTVVSVWMLNVPSADVELLAKVLDPTAEPVTVPEIDSAEEEKVEFVLRDDDKFALGRRVAKLAEVLEMNVEVKGVLEE